MSKDWIEDVKKYAPKADDAVLESMLKTYRLTLSNADSAYVAFGDPEELARVRDNFLKKKLGLTESEEKLDAAIKEVGEVLKGVNHRSRLTVYYLLAEKFGKLGVFK